MKARRNLLAAPLALLLCGVLSYSQPQLTTVLDTVELTKSSSPALVLIKGFTADNTEISGSGFLIDDSGTIVTNLHVIQELKTCGVRLSTGDTYDAIMVRAIDERKDLAVIQVAGFDLPTLTFGNSNNVKTGEQVLLLGNPLEFESSVTSGIVSGIRQLDGFQVFQTDAAVNPGNSGGPMLNKNGEVIGVVTAKRKDAENINFAVPINYVRGLLPNKESYPLDQLQTRLIKTPDVFREAASSAIPHRWKSLISGTIKLVRVEGEHLYVETVLPDVRKELGNFILADLKKTGDKYIGIGRSSLSCEYFDWVGQQRINTCASESPIEIKLITPRRIEGSIVEYPENDKFNCGKCSHNKSPIKMDFVWIPE